MSDILGPPTSAGYTQFLRDNGFSTTVLPDNSSAITISFNVAQGIVSDQLNQIDPDIFTLATYNLATDRLVNFAQDQPGQNFFTELRKQYNVYAFWAGVIQSSSDESTSQTFVIPDSMKTLTLLDVQNLKTPWGRVYVEFAQLLGQGLWGVT